jgi:hypothetical protein
MTPRDVHTTILCLLVSASFGCGFSSSPSSPSASASSGDGTHYTSELSFCVDEVNRLRSVAGKPSLVRSDVLEKYAATAVQADALAGKPHTYALSTNFGDRTALAENEALFWPLPTYKSVRAVVEQSLAEMWREGPGGEHYDIMIAGYGQVGCGVFVQGDRVAVLEAFR